MHGAFTKDPLHGISMLPITKLVKMCGGDALHVGTLGAGKMSGTVKEDRLSLDECLKKDKRFKTMMPVCSGGVYPGMMAKMIRTSGFNVQIQAGGGVAGHPGGVRKGAMGMCQAIDAAFYGIDVEVYAKDHPELKAALDEWGIK
jgi:ribulose-bisphosphate carboxylase large chain